MPATRRLDLPAVERALREVQARFAELSQHFTEPRDPFTDEVLLNVVEGYALIDDYVARGVDLFDLQQLNLMLEINATVLCGSDPARFKGMEARFSSPVMPGESLTVRMWETGDGEAIFQTAGDDGRVVIDAGKLTYEP